MSSSELFPTSITNTVTTNDNQNSNTPQFVIQQNKQKQFQITRPNSKLSSNANKQKTVPRRASTALNHRTRAQASPQNGKTSLYSPQISTIRSNKKVKVSKRTYEVLNNPNSLPFNIEELKSTINQLKYLQQIHIDSSEYPEAQQIQRIIRMAEKKLKNEEDRKNCDTDLQNTLFKRQELQAIVDKFVEDWSEHYNYFVETTRNEVNQLRKQNQEELELYDLSEPQDLLPKYKKPSTTLIKMRNKERALALNKEFLEAEKMKNKADVIEEAETKHQFKIQQENFLKKREQLISKQNEKLSILFTHAESTRLIMLQQRDNLLNGYLKRMVKIDSEIQILKDKGKLTENDISNITQINENRERKVTDGEYSYPIPRIRPGTAFLNARNGFVTKRIRSKKQPKKSNEYSIADFDEDAANNEVPAILTDNDGDEINNNLPSIEQNVVF